MIYDIINIIIQRTQCLQNNQQKQLEISRATPHRTHRNEVRNFSIIAYDTFFFLMKKCFSFLFKQRISTKVSEVNSNKQQIHQTMTIDTSQRLARLRQLMTKHEVHAYIIPSEDAHQVKHI